MIWGWVKALRTPRRRLAGLVPFATLALLLVWPFTEAGRFLVPLVPFLLVGAVEGLAGPVARVTRRRPRTWAAGIVLAATLPYAAYSVAAGRAEAQRETHADFDAACRWIARHATRPGPVLSRHPGEVYWQTGRLGIAPESPEPEAIDRLIGRLGVPYLLIDDARYANEAPNPLSRYVERYPDRVDAPLGEASRRLDDPYLRGPPGCALKTFEKCNAAPWGGVANERIHLLPPGEGAPKGRMRGPGFDLDHRLETWPMPGPLTLIRPYRPPSPAGRRYRAPRSSASTRRGLRAHG